MRIVLKILGFSCGCFIIFCLAVASNSAWLDKWSVYTQSPYRFGDLYLFSNLSEFRVPIHRGKIRTHNKTPQNNISLTVIGDSFIQNFDSTSFNAQEYRFVHWNNAPDTIPALDSTKTNVLIIESIERYCRWRLLNNTPLHTGEKKKKNTEEAEIKLSAEDKLQYVITNMDWALPFKELKSSIYLRWFNKLDNRVGKPDGSGRLYLEETVNPEKKTSSFYPIDSSEVNELVKNSNLMYENCRKLGFNKVYLSLIPNSSSLYYTSKVPYNHFIELIQGNPNFHVPYMDVYHLLRKQRASVFYPNDAHWNLLGQALWLNEVNSLLQKVKN